jgi:Malonate decarboxylase gamma subunit (MdcE)
LYGASARAAAGIGSLVDDDAGTIRRVIVDAARVHVPFDRTALRRWDAVLSARLAVAGLAPAAAPKSRPELPIFGDARPVDPLRWLWRHGDSEVYLLRPLAPQAFGPAQAVAMAQALSWLTPNAALVIVEDSPGHAATRTDEVLGVSEYLAAHAARLAFLDFEGHVVLGLLAGRGHSAAFFANALQAATLDGLAESRVEAMAPEAIARVTRLPATELAALIEGDLALGQPVRHLAALGGVARIHGALTPTELVARVAELR